MKLTAILALLAAVLTLRSYDLPHVHVDVASPDQIIMTPNYASGSGYGGSGRLVPVISGDSDAAVNVAVQAQYTRLQGRAHLGKHICCPLA
jgi:hypothetical protein